jgi:hypothetical protein
MNQELRMKTDHQFFIISSSFFIAFKRDNPQLWFVLRVGEVRYNGVCSVTSYNRVFVIPVHPVALRVAINKFSLANHRKVCILKTGAGTINQHHVNTE